MKKFLLNGFMLFCGTTSSYSQILPDPFPDPPSNSNFYYQNRGQLIDEQGNPHPEIKYYTERTFPAMFLADDKVSFVGFQQADTAISGDQDSVARIDLKFICTVSANKPTDLQVSSQFCGEINTYEPSDDHLNYYLPHCPNGIENVPGFARVVYENAFPNTDVHFYSNSWALKSYIVVKPGGNPSNIHFKFEGQDSIKVLANGSLAMYLKAWKMGFPQAIAYQLDASNNIIPVNWLPTWNHSGGGNVNLLVGSYNANQTLVIAIGGEGEKPTNIKNLEWSVYYGAAGTQEKPLATTNASNILYNVMTENSGLFLSQNGQQQYSAGARDWYISKFNAIGGREWATYYGGSSVDEANAIEESQPGTNNGELWIAGWTASLNAPLGPVAGVFKQTVNAGLTHLGADDGLLASFSKDQGHLRYGTYFGGGEFNNDRILDMSIDNVDNTLYIVGYTVNSNGLQNFNNNCATQTSGAFPLCSGNGRYFKGSRVAGIESGFIAEIGLQNKTLNWSTLFGGSDNWGGHTDKIKTVLKVHNVNENALYIGGLSDLAPGTPILYTGPITSSPIDRFPLVNPGSGAFVQTSTGADATYDASNGYIARFNSSYQLAWSTLMGRSEWGITGLAMNTIGDLYSVGDNVWYLLTIPNSSLPNSFGSAPFYHSGSAYYSTTGTTHISRFSPNHNLLWSTRFKTQTPILALDDEDKAYLLGSDKLNEAPAWQVAAGYWQEDNASGNNPSGNNHEWDGVISVFNPSNQPVWGTYFGGFMPNPTQDANSYDYIRSVAVAAHKYLFVSGITACPNSPYKECPAGAYCDQSYNTGGDGYISRFNLDEITDDPVGIFDPKSKDYQQLLVYPNPSDGIFNVTFFNNTGQKKAEMIITDQLGRNISSTTLKLQPGENRFKINMDGLASATYFLRISNKESNSYGKLQKK